MGLIKNYSLITMQEWKSSLWRLFVYIILYSEDGGCHASHSGRPFAGPHLAVDRQSQVSTILFFTVSGNTEAVSKLI